MQTKLDFDVLDCTTVWPEEDYPLREVGRMTLKRNPKNFFAENETVRGLVGVRGISDDLDCAHVLLEPWLLWVFKRACTVCGVTGCANCVVDVQMAFSPSNVVPGAFFPRIREQTVERIGCIRRLVLMCCHHVLPSRRDVAKRFDQRTTTCLGAGVTFSNDKMLQTRLFSYSDAQRYRIGVNYQQLPVNKPVCPFHENNYEGAMQMKVPNENVDYWPSNFRKEEVEAPDAKAVQPSGSSVEV